MSSGRRTIEIQLEELHENVCRASIAGTLRGAVGSATYRFVGRLVASDEHDGDVVGDVFPLLRFEGVDDSAEPGAHSEAAQERLEELDRSLQQAGWRPIEPGEHWWSRRYTR